MLEKEVFVDAVNAMKEQRESDEENAEFLGEVFPYAPSGSLIPDNERLYRAIMKLLSAAMGDDKPDPVDGYTWVEWLCYENDYGRKGMEVVGDKNGRPRKITTPGELYDAVWGEG